MVAINFPFCSSIWTNIDKGAKNHKYYLIFVIFGLKKQFLVEKVQNVIIFFCKLNIKLQNHQLICQIYSSLKINIIYYVFRHILHGQISPTPSSWNWVILEKLASQQSLNFCHYQHQATRVIKFGMAGVLK